MPSHMQPYDHIRNYINDPECKFAAHIIFSQLKFLVIKRTPEYLL